ncbi:MAG: uroporphyrinogen decarboxylase [Alphaproteobacteria bacterium]|nr:uroporphyrinogen decarboxylase [Alphaproteobacteria bacterium]
MAKFLELFQKSIFSAPPLWFMRQAGRYLPEYREIRQEGKTFLDLCYTPELAAQITLQPLKRFDIDVAILFSDILVVPHALGQHVTFENSLGPQLSSLSLSSFQNELSLAYFFEKVAPVYEAIRLVKPHLPPSKAFLGFSGAPWTLALYMLEGGGSRDFGKAKCEAFQNEVQFSTFLDFLADVIIQHLIEQVRAGVQAIQLFDSWAGQCPATYFETWVLQPTRKIVSALREIYPSLPIIVFPKGVGGQLLTYGSIAGLSALSLDASVPLPWACEKLSQHLVLQGNLDPLLLVSGKDSLKRSIEVIHQEMNGRPYIFNLGHGVLPRTPIQHIEECIQWVRGLK